MPLWSPPTAMPTSAIPVPIERASSQRDEKPAPVLPIRRARSQGETPGAVLPVCRVSSEKPTAHPAALSASRQHSPSSRHSSSRLLSRLSSFGSGSKCLYANQLNYTLQEGDLFIFRGKEPHDCAIRCCTGSEYNHIALVLRRRGELVLFEANAFGVGVCPLEFYIQSYYWTRLSDMFYKVAVRQIYTKQGRGITKEMRAALYTFYDEMYGRSYTKNPLEYILAVLNIEHAEDFTTLFCSELVAGAYKRMGA